MKVKDTDTLRPLLEKGVPAEVMDWDTQLKISQAISLKRIADALDDGLVHMGDDKKILGLADIVAGVSHKLDTISYGDNQHEGVLKPR